MKRYELFDIYIKIVSIYQHLIVNKSRPVKLQLWQFFVQYFMAFKILVRTVSRFIGSQLILFLHLKL